MGWAAGAWGRQRCGGKGLRACSPHHPQVEMLYEEALYTVLYRAGTMGPDLVDDQEALLSYLQQVSPIGPAYCALRRTTAHP